MMESIKCFFTSPTKVKNDDHLEELPVIVENDYDVNEKISRNMGKPNGKTIVYNMESVINSVKQRKKYKKKNKQFDTIPESEIADISDILSNNLKFVSPNVSLENSYDVELINNNSIDKIYPKCSNSVEINNTPKKCNTESKNAFTLMMDARNKSIGMNSPGKEISPDSKLTVTDSKIKSRKLQLEAWAVKKGAAKRQELDTAHEECIRQKMEDRKTRLKNLIKIDSDDEIKSKDKVQKRKSKQGIKKLNVKNETKNENNNKISENEILITRNEKPINSNKRKRNSKLSPEQKNETSSIIQKKKIRRLLSTDSLENEKVKVVQKDENLFELLASPIKKRDSLLGYFNVIDKTSSENKENGIEENEMSSNEDLRVETKCNEKRKYNKKIRTSINQDKINEGNKAKPEETICTTPSGRPKRSCTGKTKTYNIDLEISPKKSSKVKYGDKRCNSPTVTPLKIINLQSPLAIRVIKSPSVRRLSEAIDLDYLSDSNDSSSVRKPKKIAPIFMKPIIIDPDVLKARQKFLMSGIPEKLRVEIEKQKVYEESFELDAFPTISHISQLNEAELKKIDSAILPANIKFKDEDSNISNEKKKMLFSKEFKKILTIPRVTLNRSISSNQCKIKPLDMKDCKKIVKEQINVSLNFPRVRCFKQLREKCRSNNINDSDMSNCLDKSVEIVENNFYSSNGDLLFADKYKPNNLNEFLVNSTPVQLLKKFLSSWKVEESPKNKFYDSSDDFQNNSCSNLSTDIINYVVLVGPPGCGKTNSVYALANELNFKVLEINAGSKRTGKKILQELQEATQSHNVRTKDDKINVFRKVLSGERVVDDSDSESSSGTKRKSLILIDDADIIFDQDDGFINAINQLVTTSKRPLILIANTDKCAHLLKYISNSSINYFYANIDKISHWLSMLCLVEKTYISCEEIRDLYVNNKCDTRKTINELQFFVQSGGDRNESPQNTAINNNHFILSNKNSIISDDTDTDISTDGKKIKSKKQNNIYRHKLLLKVFPHIFDIHNIKFNIPKILKLSMDIGKNANKTRKSKSPKKVKQTAIIALENQGNFYENLSKTFYLKRNSQENDCLNYNLSDEIFSEVLRLTVKCDDETEMPGISFKNPNTSHQRSSKRDVTSCLHFNVPSKYIRNNIDLDYEPCLRSICRSEQGRAKSDRRGSRFYHYLRNMTTLTSFNLEEFDKYCNHFNG